MIVLGDARTNGREPHAEIFGTIAERAGRTFWLNPEPRLYWNYGDSVMAAYEPYCDGAFECWTTKHLEQLRQRDRGRRVPAPLHPLEEALRLFAVEALTERDRGELQLAAAMIDQLQQQPLLAGRLEPRLLLDRGGSQQGKIVVVTEMIGQVICVANQMPEQLGLGIPDQPQLIPEVLDPLSPFVQVGDARLLLHLPQPLAATTVGAVQAGPDQIPPFAVERPGLHPLPPEFEGARSLGHRLVENVSRRPLTKVVLQGAPEGEEPLL